MLNFATNVRIRWPLAMDGGNQTGRINTTDVTIRRASLCATQSRQSDQIIVPCVTLGHLGADQ